MDETSGNARYRALRVLGLVLCAALAPLGLAMYFAIGTLEDGMASPPNWVLLAQVVYALVVLGLVETLGYRTAPAESGEPQAVGLDSVEAYRSAMILRLVMGESLAILSMALAFVLTPSTFLVFLYGGLLSLALMVFEVLPNQRSVAKIEASLERGGRPSHLREALGLSG